jgi:RNA polymerase sigma-70 factor (ECF subfamily)
MVSSVSETDQTDEQLAAAAARRGDSDRALWTARDTFERLYRRHAPLLLAFLAARTGPSDRDDLHQEVWRRAWDHLPQHFDGRNFSGWLYQIARNALIDHGRKRKAQALVDPEVVPDSRAGRDDDRLVERERMEALRRCLEKLGSPAAAVVRARLAGEEYPELCRRLGMTSGQAYRLFHSAKDQLKTCVERALK